MNIENDMAVIERQEQCLVIPNFDADVGWQIGAYLRELAKLRGLSVAIEVRTFGHLIFAISMIGATPDNFNWMRRKSNTVAHFRQSSYAIGLRLALTGSTISEVFGLSNNEYAIHGGSFPLIVKDAGVIGSITVSGLPQRDDHELIVEGLCALFGHDYEALKLAPEGKG
jgi:uncharacterized protein (UPF0303 family)